MKLRGSLNGDNEHQGRGAKLIEAMPEDSAWDDLMQKIYVRQAVESGLADSYAGRTTSVEALRAEFGK